MDALSGHSRLSLPDQPGSIFFTESDQGFHRFGEPGPEFGCLWWEFPEGIDSVLGEVTIPAPCSQPRSPISITCEDQNWMINYDVLAMAYWSMNRLEEIGREDLDDHRRFAATSAHASRHGYLDRPWVDEWLDVLGQLIRRQWPHLALKEPEFSLHVSHDVDMPSMYAFASFWVAIKRLGAALIMRRDVKGFFNGIGLWLHGFIGLSKNDPLNTFDWLMQESESHGLASAFYFICGRTDASKDADYDPDHPAIVELIRSIAARGHEIGLHPSYETYLDGDALSSEFQRLKSVCHEAGVDQPSWGGRMHYLRWSHPETMRLCEEVGLSYDSTLGYADRPGFRCGTCHEFPAYDPVNNRLLKLRIRPLVAMDRTVTADRYLALGKGDAAREVFVDLREKCRKVGGQFVLLWHNSELCASEDREIYRAVLSPESDSP